MPLKMLRRSVALCVSGENHDVTMTLMAPNDMASLETMENYRRHMTYVIQMSRDM